MKSPNQCRDNEEHLKHDILADGDFISKEIKRLAKRYTEYEDLHVLQKAVSRMVDILEDVPKTKLMRAGGDIDGYKKK